MTGEGAFERRCLWLRGSGGHSGALREGGSCDEKSEGGDEFHLFRDLRFVGLPKFTFPSCE